jgi:hypothetical protein
MKSLLFNGFLVVALGVAACPPSKSEPTPAAAPGASAPPAAYGANQSASGTFVHDGVTRYYETYGQGKPLLMIHGNGARLGSLAAQIDHFKPKYCVIAMDSRDHGKSSDSRADQLRPPNANLAIFPNAAHLIPYDDPAAFNAAIDHFLLTPFRNIDLIPETMASFEKLITGLPQ